MKLSAHGWQVAFERRVERLLMSRSSNPCTSLLKQSCACSLGSFDARPGYRSPLLIYPVGYTCTSYPEGLGEGHCLECQIREGGDHATFCVNLVTEGGETHVAPPPVSPFRQAHPCFCLLACVISILMRCGRWEVCIPPRVPVSVSF